MQPARIVRGCLMIPVQEERRQLEHFNQVNQVEKESLNRMKSLESRVIANHRCESKDVAYVSG